MHILLSILLVGYYIGMVIGLLDGLYDTKSTFLYDLIPFAGILRIIIKHYSKLD